MHSNYYYHYFLYIQLSSARIPTQYVFFKWNVNHQQVSSLFFMIPNNDVTGSIGSTTNRLSDTFFIHEVIVAVDKGPLGAGLSITKIGFELRRRHPITKIGFESRRRHPITKIGFELRRRHPITSRQVSGYEVGVDTSRQVSGYEVGVDTSRQVSRYEVGTGQVRLD